MRRSWSVSLRGPRGPRVVSGASHLVLAFAAAHLCTQLVPVVPGWIVFAVVFAFGRQALWHLAARFDGTPIDPRAERPEVLLSLPLAPIGLLPLAAGERLGDGALLLTTAALLALLFVVREAANLATARAEMEAERDKLERANALQDDLINLLTHEVRNPLTLVMSYAQMARRAALDKSYEHIPTYVGHVERAGQVDPTAHGQPDAVDDAGRLGRAAGGRARAVYGDRRPGGCRSGAAGQTEAADAADRAHGTRSSRRSPCRCCCAKRSAT